jgi:hypothetical protein
MERSLHTEYFIISTNLIASRSAVKLLVCAVIPLHERWFIGRCSEAHSNKYRSVIHQKTAFDTSHVLLRDAFNTAVNASLCNACDIYRLSPVACCFCMIFSRGSFILFSYWLRFKMHILWKLVAFMLCKCGLQYCLIFLSKFEKCFGHCCIQKTYINIAMITG